MNVLLITLRSDIGGGPKHLLQLAQGIKKRHPHVNIFIAAPKDEPFGPLFQQEAFAFIPLVHRKFRIRDFLKVFWFCLTEHVSTVHSHGRGAGYYSRPMKLLGIHIIHTFHGLHMESSFAGRLKVVIDKFLKIFTDRFICVSEDEQKKALAANMTTFKKVRTIRNGVALENLITEKVIREKIAIGTLARFNYQKGLDLLINAVSSFKKFNPSLDFEIKIAGDGELRKEIEEQIKSKNLQDTIQLLGFSEPDKFLNEIDIYFSFARWEGLPLSVLEAMAQKLPCLLSDVTGHGLFQQDDGAVLFDLENQEDFNNKFEKLIIDNDFRQTIANNGYALIEKEFSINDMIDKTARLYK